MDDSEEREREREREIERDKRRSPWNNFDIVHLLHCHQAEHESAWLRKREKFEMCCLWHHARALWIESVGLAWCPWLRPCSGCVIASSHLSEASPCGCACVCVCRHTCGSVVM